MPLGGRQAIAGEHTFQVFSPSEFSEVTFLHWGKTLFKKTTVQNPLPKRPQIKHRARADFLLFLIVLAISLNSEFLIWEAVHLSFLFFWRKPWLNLGALDRRASGVLIQPQSSVQPSNTHPMYTCLEGLRDPEFREIHRQMFKDAHVLNVCWGMPLDISCRQMCGAALISL